MSTMLKHKDRSRKTFNKDATTKRSVFSAMERRGYLLLQSKLTKQKGGV
ncbi:MAG: hypothetical protein J6Y02_16285 [Pseudobutyrivibrio sp.]|nr:hypothetical protein [Pseudobutyrivibrio sp.]